MGKVSNMQRATVCRRKSWLGNLHTIIINPCIQRRENSKTQPGIPQVRFSPNFSKNEGQKFLVEF
jgi:hypothetical protein